MSLKMFILKILPLALKFQNVFSWYVNADQSQPWVRKYFMLNRDHFSGYMPNHDQPYFFEEIFFSGAEFFKVKIFFFIPPHKLIIFILNEEKVAQNFVFSNDILFFYHCITLNERGFFYLEGF